MTGIVEKRRLGLATLFMVASLAFAILYVFLDTGPDIGIYHAFSMVLITLAFCVRYRDWFLFKFLCMALMVGFGELIADYYAVEVVDALV